MRKVRARRTAIRDLEVQDRVRVERFPAGPCARRLSAAGSPPFWDQALEAVESKSAVIPVDERNPFLR